MFEEVGFEGAADRGEHVEEREGGYAGGMVSCVVMMDGIDV